MYVLYTAHDGTRHNSIFSTTHWYNAPLRYAHVVLGSTGFIAHSVGGPGLADHMYCYTGHMGTHEIRTHCVGGV